MHDIVDYIMRHQEGGKAVAILYTQLEEQLRSYDDFMLNIDAIQGKGETIVPVSIPGYPTSFTVIDPVEWFIGPLGDVYKQIETRARTTLEMLMFSRWGNLQLVQENYVKIMRVHFPKNYEGIRIPPNYMTIDSKLTDVPPPMLEG